MNDPVKPRFKVGDVVWLAWPRADAILMVEVMLLDVRANFGRFDWWVQPTRGDGKTWVSEDSLHDLHPHP